MKKLLIIVAVSLFSASLFAANPTETIEKVKNSFKEAFSDVKNPQWFDNGDTYVVRFVRNKIDTRITYDTNGDIIKTFRYYQGENLPDLLKGKLKTKFNDKKVFSVTEINSDAGLEYHITLQDDKTWTVVKAESNGDLTVYKKFKKA